WAGTLPSKTEYGIEAVSQTGSLGPDTIAAWAGHFQLKSPAFGPKLRATGEYNVASGDKSPTDGTRGTFDQLYPTPHDKYGLADQVGWKNVHHLRTGLEFKPRSTLLVSAGYHSFWLASNRDALYSAAGAVLGRI